MTTRMGPRCRGIVFGDSLIKPTAATDYRMSLVVIIVMFHVVLRGLVGMVRGMHAVAMRQMGVMRGLFVVAALVVLGGLAMVLGGVLVMLGGGMVMILMRLSHRNLLSRMPWPGP